MCEAMFDKDTGQNLLNPDCTLYQEIAKIAHVMRTTEPLRFGRMYFRQISDDGVHFGFPYGTTYTLAFSRLLYGKSGSTTVQQAPDGALYVQLDLGPRQFVILQ
jgi:hypothetical protein